MQADMGRDVGCCGAAAGKRSCHFITKVSGAVGRRQELLGKCIQGKGVPLPRKGTTFWPSPGAWGKRLAGWRRRHWSGTQRFTAGAVRSSRFLAVGELCWLTGTFSVHFFCVLLALFGCPIKYLFCFYPWRRMIFFLFCVRRKGGRHREGWWAFSLSKASEVC